MKKPRASQQIGDKQGCFILVDYDRTTWKQLLEWTLLWAGRIEEGWEPINAPRVGPFGGP